MSSYASNLIKFYRYRKSFVNLPKILYHKAQKDIILPKIRRGYFDIFPECVVFAHFFASLFVNIAIPLFEHPRDINLCALDMPVFFDYISKARKNPPGYAKRTQFALRPFSLSKKPVIARTQGAESQASATLSTFKNLSRRFPTKTFSRAMVNKIDNIIYGFLRNCTKIETFRKEETQ